MVANVSCACRGVLGSFAVVWLASATCWAATEGTGFYVPADPKYTIVNSFKDSLRFTVERTLVVDEKRHLVSRSSFVDPEGKVTNAEIVKSGGGGFDEEALKAVKQSRFEPAQRDGQNVPAEFTFVYRFRLKR